MSSVSIANAMADPVLFEPWFRGPSWDTWCIVLRAAYGLPLTESERDVFRQLAERDAPTKRVRELWCICGRRAGKDSIASLIAAYEAALFGHSDKLRPGERASVLCLAADRDQARIVHGYVTGYFEKIPMLAGLVERATQTGLELANGVDITVATSDFRAVRGRTVLAAVLDEVSFWRDERSVNPDTEVYAALAPALMTLPDTMLVGITTPYKKSGLAFQKFRKSFGQPDDDVLVIRAPSLMLNPTLDARVIDRALEDDYEAARAEWLAEWRNDISGFVTPEIVSACVGDFAEAAPIAGIRYHGFVDPSGGSSNSMTLAIGHREDREDGERIVVDAIREVRPPFSPEGVVDEFAELLKRYSVTTVKGDRYAGQWPREQFAKRSITYLVCDKPKSDLYRDLLPKLNSGQIQIPKSDRLVAQLVGLERRTARGGRNSIDHAPGSHDDLANAIAGVADCVGLAAPYFIWQSTRDGGWEKIGSRPKPPPLPYRPPNPEAFNQHQQRHAAKQTAWQNLARTLRG